MQRAAILLCVLTYILCLPGPAGEVAYVGFRFEPRMKMMEQVGGGHRQRTRVAAHLRGRLQSGGWPG